ncbi:MAG: hypothetical protein HYS04_20210 [Acidobacteria bacterium]|nr:hypothetical protein [Acidobacteriota bacterium]
MSTREVIWVNQSLAALARQHHMDALRPVWTTAGDRRYSLSLETGGRSASTFIDIDAVRSAYLGDESVQVEVDRALRGLVKSLLGRPC